MASFLPDTDSEDELPLGWEERVTLDGKVYYANHQDESTQWTHPKSGKKKRVSGELPFGWEKTVEADGTVIFVDHINKRTSYTDPRLAFAVEDKEAGDDVRQQFGASSTGLQVLQGRDLSGKVAIVTGGNCGIGYETCRALAYHGARVIMACRDTERASVAIAKIVSERPHAKLDALKCDLSSLSSVKHFTEQFEALDVPLHMLILNAGVFALPHELTENGIERTFQVNHLSHFYLTQLLEKKLIKSAPSRVVVVSSESHRFSSLSTSNISKEYLSPSSSQFYAMVAYNDSKLCNVLFSAQLNRRLRTKQVTSESLHPGNMMSSNLSRHWWLYRALFALVRPFTKSLDQGASTTVYCATSLELDGVGGSYFNNCIPCTPSKAAQDVELAKQLWQLSEDMIRQALS
ncbi:WW domain-containing oxidoreductase [Halotydeus destructor]|nr:WW domain-containing oxidoreductase [Halotydeus destructor]